MKVDNLIWFNQNLSFKTKNSEPIDNVSNPEGARLYSYYDSKIACPEGWRLPLVEEFDKLISEIFQINFYGQTTVDFNLKIINNNHIGFNFDQIGFLHKKKYKSRESFNLWLHNNDNESAFHVHMYDTKKGDKGKSLTIFRHNHTIHKPKKHRKFAVRCVCEAGKKD